MTLKGVMLGRHKRDDFAVIDRGGRKGCIIPIETGEAIEGGLVLKEITKDSVRIEKGEFGVVLRLFSPAFQRTAAVAPKPDADVKAGERDVKKQGSITRISKSLADKLKANNNMIMSSIAVKPAETGPQLLNGLSQQRKRLSLFVGFQAQREHYGKWFQLMVQVWVGSLFL